MEIITFKEFIGEKIKSIFKTEIEKGYSKGNDQLIFELENGKKYRFYHQQDCCEGVYIEDINGDLNDLIGKEIIKFEEKIETKEVNYGSETYTFYDIETFDKHIQIRWYGSSNGYYSESVDFEEIKE